MGKKQDKREILENILNVAVVISVGAGMYIMLAKPDEGAVLTGSGIENLKFFTVLSNLFCGIVALLRLLSGFWHKKIHIALKLVSASEVAVFSCTGFCLWSFLCRKYSDKRRGRVAGI